MHQSDNNEKDKKINYKFFSNSKKNIDICTINFVLILLINKNRTKNENL